MEVELVLEKGC